jgi:hypothetical protein
VWTLKMKLRLCDGLPESPWLQEVSDVIQENVPKIILK